ncbi:MAG: phage protease [Acetobacter sp.]|uniref:phage protease n=1 Tax=Acetobacter sp. TaxID=440 RepID=UPI0039EA72CC
MSDLHFHTTTLPESDTPPEWIHLLPAGSFRGVDGRGPYHVENTDALIRNSMGAGKLVLDENHATDHAARTGGSAPAVGWIVELQGRSDGVWGRVDWNRAGTQLMSDKQYRGVSPAFAATKTGAVTRLVRASLTNMPNLSLTHLHTENPKNQETRGMDLADVARRLGLPAGATEAEVNAALDRGVAAISLHTQMATTLGLPGNASGEAIVTGLQAKAESVTKHTQELEALRGKVKTLTESEGKIWLEDVAKRKVVSESLSPTLLSLHTSDPKAADAIVEGLMDVPDSSVVTHTQRQAAREGGASTDAAGVDKGLLAKMDAELGIAKEGK